MLRTFEATPAETEEALAEATALHDGIARLKYLVADDLRPDDFPHLLEAAKRRRHSAINPPVNVARAAVFDPVEATRRALDQAEQTQSRFNAFIDIQGDQALAEARRATTTPGTGRRPLAGVPFAYKDAFATVQRKPTVGVGLGHRWDGPPSTSLRRLQQAGAIAIGATNLDPHCYSVLGLNPFFGPTLNPHDPRFTAGGSSGGSAVAVAAGVVPFALGTDTGGSVRIPAALCGVFGLKPTHGRIVDAGVAPLSRSQDTVGILAGSPEMIGEVFHLLQTGRRNLPERQVGPTDATGLRIGIDRENLCAAMDNDVAAVLERLLERLARGGAEITDAPFLSIADLNLCAGVITGREAAILHAAALAAKPQHFPPNIRRRLLVAACVPENDYVVALRLRCSYLRHVLYGVLNRVDFIVCPTVPVRAARLEDLAEPNSISQLTREYLSLNRPFSLLGLPSLSVPAGRDGNGVPVGLQIVGRPFDDEAIISLAGYLFTCPQGS